MHFRILILFCLISKIKAQSFEKEYIVISNIEIIGNKKTKKAIIMRELDIAIGDTILTNNIPKLIEKNKNKIINLGLFLNVEIAQIECEAPNNELHIYVAEQLFILPIPIFRLADRSFNEWWYNRNHDLSRVIYGVNFVHFNVGGRAQEMMINMEGGFTKQLALIYKIPYINSKMKTGIDFAYFINTNKQIPYRTNNDKLMFVQSDENILLKKSFVKVVLRRRNNFYERQRLELSYHNEKILDSVAYLNPNYFLNSKTKLTYFKASYVFEGDHRDNTIYPSTGHHFVGRVSRSGLFKTDNINQNELHLSYAYYMRLGKKWFVDFNLRAKVTSPGLQPFATSTAIGYKTDNIRGYDLYVIDGQKLGIAKANIRKLVFDTSILLPYWGPWKNAQKFPIEVYARAFFDTGYVFNKYPNLNNSQLANRYLSGFGLGLDVVSIYTNSIKISYSLNNIGEKGLFFALGKEF
jgi:outer membrane protein assembly factor BamA